MDNAWKNNLRERFSDYSAPEPEGLWEGIEQGMAGKQRRKMLPVWLISGLAAAAAVALVVILPSRKAGETLRQSDPVREEFADALPADTVETAKVPVEEVVPRPVPIAVASRHTLLSEAEPAEAVAIPAFEEAVPDAVHELVPPADPVEEMQPSSEKEQPSENVQVEKQKPEIIVFPEEKPLIPRKHFSISAFRQGGQASSSQSKGFGLHQAGEYLTRSTDGSIPQNMNKMVMMLASNQASTLDVRHGTPVRIGVKAAWEMTPNLSLVTGVNWTTLHSVFEETSGVLSTETSQALGYLGVPLRLQAGVNLWKGLWLYADAGGMVEKGLSASSKTLSYAGGQLRDTKENARPDMGGLLWSVGASAGAEYRFNNLIGVYVAPGLEYHFANGSAVRSAYTEKPLCWTLDAGVRFRIF